MFITLDFGYLSWKYIQYPFRYKKRFNPRIIFALSSSVWVCYFVIGISKRRNRNRYITKVLIIHNEAHKIFRHLQFIFGALLL